MIDAYMSLKNVPVSYVPAIESEIVDFCDLEPGDMFATVYVCGEQVKITVYKKTGDFTAVSITGDQATFHMSDVYRVHVNLVF